ncbi:MAG: MFS transporter [Firmicutes bacterium]|nr:MFS transporter [Bacillota bacterium]
MSITVRYILLQCFFWCLYAFPWSFTAVYLSRCGISNTGIGLVTGVSSVLSVILQPALISVTVKYKCINFKNVLAFSAVIFIIFGAVMLFNKTPEVTLVSFLVVSTLSASVPSVISIICMEYINSGIPVNFGLARGLGSISYAVLVFVTGKMVSTLGADVLVPVYIFFSAAWLIVVIIMKMPESNMKKKDNKITVRELFRENKEFLPFLAASVLLFMSHFMINGFLIKKITDVGGNSFHLGVSLFISAAVELPVMSCIVLIIRRFGIKNIIVICSVFFVLKTIVLLFADDVSAVYVSQFMQFGAFAIYTPASVYYVNMTLKEKYRATGQAMTGAATLGIGSALGNITGGAVIDNYDINTMLWFALVFAGAGCGILLVQKILHKNFSIGKAVLRTYRR